MPLITFHELIPHAYPPSRAWKSALGQLPDRHHKCEPVRAASGLGWYVHLPMDFVVVFDGADSTVSLDGGETWQDLTVIHHADATTEFNRHAPTDCQGYIPPFLQMTEDHSILQVWTGYVARTAPDYSVLVRPPINIVASQGYHHLEGIIETDVWCGPLFTNIKLLRTSQPIYFHEHRPFIQVQPIHRASYDDRLLNDFEVKGYEGLDWPAYKRTVVDPNADPVERRLGAYAAEARKRRAQENRDA